jgi:hypothetical protein
MAHVAAEQYCPYTDPYATARYEPQEAERERAEKDEDDDY